MAGVVVGTEALVILLLIVALLVGQPAVVPALESRVSGQSTEVAWLRATVSAYPAPTAQRSVCAPAPRC